MSRPTLRTERLMLRPWRDEDLPALAHGFDDLGLNEIVSFTVPANVRS